MDKIKYSDPVLTEAQLHSTLQRILRLNPARPMQPAEPLVADACTNSQRHNLSQHRTRFRHTLNQKQTSSPSASPTSQTNDSS